jgi:hypothetical protein
LALSDICTHTFPWCLLSICWRITPLSRLMVSSLCEILIVSTSTLSLLDPR